MLFRFIKDDHRVQSQKQFDSGIPVINEEISDWLEETWTKHQVNLAAFAFNWINKFFDHEDMWPASHQKKVNIPLESTTMIISRKATCLISTLYIII